MKLDKAWPAAKVEERDTTALVPYARNARTHTEAQVAQLVASIKEWGWTNPVLVDEGNMIIAGHGRLLAAQQLGMEKVPVMVARGWTKAQKAAYVIADNKLAENAGWDKELLKVELEGLTELDFDLGLTGFGDLELGNIMASKDSLEEGYEKEIEVPVDPVAQPGDLWELGPHRVYCGDSTDADCVAMLFDGHKPGIMVTDPPYGVEYDPDWRNRATRKDDKPVGERSVGKVQNDDRIDWTDAWRLFPGDVMYVWHASWFISDVHRNIRDANFDTRALIIWNKSRFAMGRGDYHWKHEPLWYAVRKSAKSGWKGDRTQSTVWDIQTSDDGDKTIHSTQKPLECMGRPLRNHTFDEVYDPFLGAGTTLIAAHLLEKTCFGLEIDPGYVDVIIQRWQDRTKIKAKCKGKTYDSLLKAKEAKK